MQIQKQIEKLQSINLFIEKATTGNSSEFAMKLKISRSHLFNYFEELKHLGAEIKFNRKTKNYSYKNNIKLKINFPVEIIQLN